MSISRKARARAGRFTATIVAITAGPLAVGQAAAQTASSDTALTEIIVTGSRIRSPDATSVSPISTVSGEELQQRGVTRVEDLINTLPQAYADQGAGNRGGTVGASGTATINLRNLGNQRTLVLIDGRRLMQGDPDRTSAQAPDINNVPAALIERIDVVTGGASAVYGSDALAGVVNFVLKKDFDGVQVDTTNGFYSHTNNNPIRAVSAAAKQAYPGGATFDGPQNDVSITAGKNFAGGRGNITGFFSYRHAEGVGTSDRDFSICGLSAGAGGYSCSLSSATYPAQFQPLNLKTGAARGTYTLDGATGNTLRTYKTSDGFNNGPTYDLQSPDQRYNLDLFGHYEYAPGHQVYGEFMFMRDEADIRLSPTAVFSVAEKVNCDNPYLSAQEVSVFCTTAGLTPAQTANVVVSERDVQAGSRHDYTTHTAYRGVLGAKGDISDDWQYDVYAQYGRTNYDSRLTGDISLSNFANALQAVTNSSGQIVCKTGAAGCVPINIFAIGGITPGALGYVQQDFYRTGFTEEVVASGAVTGQLSALTSPLAHSPLGVAFGTEYRRESIGLTPDSHYSSKDVAGNSGGEFPISGAFDVKELFAELTAPLVQDRPFFHSLSLNAGARYSDYSTAGDTTAYKAGGEWAPDTNIRFRGSFQRAVRAPNLVELYGPQQITTANLTDPCEGAHPTASLAACQASGVTAAQYGNIAPAAGQKSGAMIGGNPGLRPEESNTVSFGTQITPSFLPGVTLTADYFDIDVKKLISTVPATIELSQCIATGTFCNLVVRNPTTGSLVTSGYVVTTYINAGYLDTSGVDFSLSAKYDVADLIGVNGLGRVGLNFSGTFTDKYEIQVLPNTPSYRCEGYFGVTCGMPIPKWRHRMVVDWTLPDGVDLMATWRYIGGTRNDKSSSAVYLAGAYQPYDATLPSVSYLDLGVSLALTDDISLRVGVNNVFDKDPPLTASTGGQVSNGAFYSGIYDALGRYVFTNVSARF
ncbi:TonB-dependent receptor-like protein [Nitrospirillum amazonense]|uniref:TonB-dependent receptor-like protein n=1 Tax=Nitrospirillum amazonense TaxID=28077 RepID=A0A560FJT5_9PROT|nr:TonB-dependent receptor [Nitrospirillum amazonense]TWB21867.1 TonB-dependent receptor-like protein [Nitrospirillum amazonense]